MVEYNTCLICKGLTLNKVCPIELEMSKGFDVCEPCEGKFGKWDNIEKKLLSLKLPSKVKKELTQKKVKKEFKASVSYSGGDKSDIVELVCRIIDNECIWDEVMEKLL